MRPILRTLAPLLGAALAAQQPAPAPPGAPRVFHVAGDAPGRPSVPVTPLRFGFRDRGRDVLVEIEGDVARGTIAGEPLAQELLRRDGARWQVLDRDGLVAAEIEPGPRGGTLRVFPDRGRALLGVRLAVPTAADAAAAGRAASETSLVLAVVPGLGAARAGLRPGDLLLEIDGGPATDARLRELLAARRPGDALTLTARRGADELRFTVELSAASGSASARLSDAPVIELHGDRMLVLGGSSSLRSRPSGDGTPEATARELQALQRRLDRSEALLQQTRAELERARQQAGARK